MVNFRKSNGFTLLELLIAMAIFSVISYTMFASIKQITNHGEVLIKKPQALSKLQTTIAIIQNDFLQMAPRDVRDEDGNILPAMFLDINGNIEFSRAGAGLSNQLTLQRVAYFMDGDKLYRKTWESLDRPPGDIGRQTVVLENINDFKIELLGLQGWVIKWPEDIGSVLPRMVKITLKLQDKTSLTRVFPGVSN